MIRFILLAVLWWPLLSFAYQYKEDFNGWIDSNGTQGTEVGCTLGRLDTDGSLDSSCNDSLVWWGFTGLAGEVWVESRAQCRSGKCFVCDYNFNESQCSFAPKVSARGASNEGSTPATGELFARWYLRFATFQLGAGETHKLFRSQNPVPAHSFVARNTATHLDFDEAGNHCRPDDGVDDFQISNFTDQWFKVEVWLQAQGSNQWTCQTWITTDPGGAGEKVWTGGPQTGDYGGNTVNRMWIVGNRSAPANIGLVYMDDVCIGETLADRTGFCAETASTNGSLIWLASFLGALLFGGSYALFTYFRARSNNRRVRAGRILPGQ